MPPSRVTSASRKSGTTKFTVEEIDDKEYNAAIIYNKKKLAMTQKTAPLKLYR